MAHSAPPLATSTAAETPSGTSPAGERFAVVVNGNAKSVSEEVIETLDSIFNIQ